jgi:sugar/nucleoside kinase (ribokinase family)
MVPDAGANAAFAPADVDERVFRPGRHLHLSAYVMFGRARLTALWTLMLARAAGMSISVDAASAAPLSALGAEAFARLVGRDILLFANVDEATVLTGDREPLTAVVKLAALYGQAIVKCGRDGALWARGNQTLQAPGRVVTVVDSTGAGDAFTAGYLHAIGCGAAPQEALDAANALGSAACTRLGGQP